MATNTTAPAPKTRAKAKPKPKTIAMIDDLLYLKHEKWDKRFSKAKRLLIIGCTLFFVGALIGKIYTDYQIQNQFRFVK